MTYTDRINGLESSLAFKAPVRAATTANITLSGEQTIDGIAIVADDRVLVKDQTDATENGIYTASATAWVRALDFNGARDCAHGTQVVVTLGTISAKTVYWLNTVAPVIGTSSLTFEMAVVVNATARTRATNRTEAEAEAKNISDMYGYAEANGCTGGGGGGTVRWVTNGLDAEYDPPVGSLRAALDASSTGDVIVFDPTLPIRVNLVASINTTGTDGLIIAAPGGNVEVAHPGDMTAFRIYSNNIILRGIKEVALPKLVEGGTDRDFIDVNPDVCRLYWIDQITSDETHDGAIDIATPVGDGVLATPSYGTVSRSIFRGVDKSSLIRCSDAADTDATMIYVTWYLDWFDHSAQRNPSAREQAKADVVNCFYGLQQKTQSGGSLGACYGADARTGGEITVRGSWFTTTVGSGFKAVSQGDGDGSVASSNCFSQNSLTFDSAGSPTVPAYTIPVTTAVDGDAGRDAMLSLVQSVAGSDPVEGLRIGEYAFDATSTQEPNGHGVRATYGDVAGRYVRPIEIPLLPLTDVQKITIGTGNTNDGQLAAVIGDGITVGSTARNILSVGRDHDVDSAADDSFSAGRGHNMETTYGVSLGAFPVDDTNAIFRVGTGTSDGSRETALQVDLSNGTTWFRNLAVKRVNTVAISSGIITVTGGYHTVSTEGGAGTDTITSIVFAETPTDGQRLILMPSSSGAVITVEHGSAALLPGGVDVDIDGAYAETIELMWSAHKSALVKL